MSRSHHRRPGLGCVQPDAGDAPSRPERPDAVRDDLPRGDEQLRPVRRGVVSRHLDNTVRDRSAGEHQRTVGVQDDHQVGADVGPRPSARLGPRLGLGLVHLARIAGARPAPGRPRDLERA